ncbi:MAG: chemoreceptor glutamine deamidase CheD [Marinobacter sp.]|uniref:chemoreceptor glutamine deamidase CheD n=1 Tax=Marinobacter sp. TaxID=50741 RepID=UPI00299EBBF0|nr:chemoreceptor glutamine deamidase CheD [Marinobacter sp.]MDX1756110.1 chemoreceptor glutamine deamidase CheD [Marinobacter sp.]
MSLSVGHWATNVYYDRRFERQAAKLLPGEYYVSAEPMVIVTVLGSCVAACLQDPVARMGGMNHFLLPDNTSDDDCKSARYGSFAMELLINELLSRGARRDRLQAKVFGGGRVIESFSANPVGDRNAEFVRRYLQAEKIPIIASDLLGDYPRKVYQFPDTAQVLVKKIRHIRNDTIFIRERILREQASQDAVGGEIDLFVE